MIKISFFADPEQVVGWFAGSEVLLLLWCKRLLVSCAYCRAVLNKESQLRHGMGNASKPSLSRLYLSLG